MKTFFNIINVILAVFLAVNFVSVTVESLETAMMESDGYHEVIETQYVGSTRCQGYHNLGSQDVVWVNNPQDIHGVHNAYQNLNASNSDTGIVYSHKDVDIHKGSNGRVWMRVHADAKQYSFMDAKHHTLMGTKESK